MRLLVVLPLVAACGSSPPRDLKVMSYAPQGAIDKAEPIEIKLDRPAVDETMVGKPAAADAIAIAPAVAWKGFWQDRQTLVIEPTAALAPSTRYQVTLAGDLGARTSRFSFAFIHRPLSVEGVWGVDNDSLPPDGDLPISFDQPVRAADAAAHCKLTGDHGDLALRAKADETAANLALQPAAKLAPGAVYTLACEGLTGAGGNVPLDKPYTLLVRARPTLSVTHLEPTGDDIPADEATITITFSTRVTLDAARKAISASPAIPTIDQGFLSTDGTEYKVTADLEVGTDYTIRVKNLVDLYGQALDKPAELKFHTGDARPRLSMERGIFALEASANGYPLWSRNVDKFAVECAQIPKDKLVRVLTTDMNYDPWGGNDDDQPIDWKALHLSAKTKQHTTAGRNKWLLNELDLGATCGAQPGARGVYLAEISSDEVEPDPNRAWLTPRKNRVLANVTDMGVLIKAGTASGLVWVTSLSTGAPIEGAQVTVFTPQGKQVWSSATTTDGLAKIPGTAVLKDQKPAAQPDPDEGDDWDSFRAQRLIAVVEKAGDVAIVDGNWANGIQLWNFGLPEDRTGGTTRIRGFIQSDRGLYRPGESVHFKGLAREIAAGAPPRVPQSHAVAVEVTDSRGMTVATSRAKLSEFGGFAFDMDLTQDAALGDYYVAATVAGQVFRERFTVEEFRPASFEVAVKSAAASPRPGERLTFDVDAHYLFGSPVGDAKIEWNLRRRRHVVRFPSYPEFSFSANPNEAWWWEDRDDYGELVADGNGQTNAQGHLAIATRDSAKHDGPIDYILSAAVTDSADQTANRSVVVTAHQTAFYLGMHANEYVQAVGMPFGVNLVAVTPDGTQTAAKVHLSFVRTDRSCLWSQVGARSYQHCDSSEKLALERDVELAAGGSHTERIYPTEPGDYIVKAEAKDAAGHAVVAASEIWVIGNGVAFWSDDEGDRMTLVASKPSYEPGDTARLVAQANLVKPSALITIERDGVIDARVIQMQSASEGIELPIADAWAPNVYASVALVSGRHGEGDQNRPQFKMGIVELKVASTHKQLDVAVALDRDRVRPGDKVTGKIHVSHDGQPVHAEVSLSAADEGVLQLIAYETPNPMKTFYASYGLGVANGTSWNRIARLADPEAGDPDQGGDRRSAGDGQRVRSKFVASAYWAPMLTTDEHGDIAFSFTAPDNLTAYRLMAVAADSGDRFGAGELRLTIDKPLMAVPALPRFLMAGDAATVGVVIHNHTDRAGTATVTARASGAALDATSQQVAVPANGTARVRFAAKASQSSVAKFEFAVAMNDERDAVAVTLPIGKPRVIETRTVTEQALGDAGRWEGDLGTAGDVLRPESTLAITVDRSGVGDLAPGLRSLVEYPYGCLEQTLSRFVPLVAAKDLAATLDDASLRGMRVDQLVKAGVAKVIRHQQGDGLFSLWPQSQTYPHLAAYALWGLTVAQKAGVEVPRDVFDRGIKALSEWANGAGNLKPDGSGATMAMAAYVMAMRGKPDAALDARLYDLRGGLPKWGQAFLLRALALANADRAQIEEVEQLIVASAVKSGGRALIRETNGRDDLEMYMSSDVRATAMTLAALLEVDPGSDLIDPLAAGLKAERTRAGDWESTEDNVWSLVALAQYAKRTAAGSTTATITIAGRPAIHKKVAGAQVAVIRVPLDQLHGDRVAVSVDGGAHVGVRVIEARADPGAAAAHGFAVERRYLDASGQPLAACKAGQLVTVELDIVADADHRWVALVDPIPAGFEVVNPKLGGPSQADVDHKLWWQAVTWDHQDMRDDRVQWFADQMGKGRYQVSYQVRATTAGTFTAMPATIEAMYHPDVRGRSGAATITISK